MRPSFHPFGLTALVLAVALGCRPSGGDEVPETNMSTRVDQFQDQAQARLATVGDELDRLMVQAAQRGDSAAMVVSQRIEKLRTQRQELADELKQLDQQAGEEYDRVVGEIEDRIAALEVAVAELGEADQADEA